MLVNPTKTLFKLENDQLKLHKNGGSLNIPVNEILNYSCKDIIRGIKLPGKSCKKRSGVRVITIQTSIIISAKDLKLLGGVFHKVYFCKDVIRVI